MARRYRWHRRSLRVLPVGAGVLFICLQASAQISPGKLSKAHQSYEGALNCTGCHVLGVGAPRFKCMSCHAEIRVRVEARRGFHGRVVRRDGGTKQECVRCHTDHYGADFNIVKWDTSRDEFDHRQAGYPLQGKHAGLACARCHNPKNMAPDAVATIRIRDKRNSLLGLTTQCSGCHADVHRGQLGADCARCHTAFNTWKEPAGFDHTSARFTLKGAHVRVACAGCHKPAIDVAAKSFTRFKDLPFASCADCHKDPHRGSFPMACASCHIESNWKDVRVSDGFNHNTATKFQLRGAHAKAACGDCHRGANFKEPVLHQACADCHRKDDPHRDQFTAQDCAACHTETAFKPSTFDVTRHQELEYRLAGKHAAVECGKCHTPVGKNANYHPAHGRCLDCHKDSHEGQFAGAAYANRCESCHSEVGFQPSTFTLSKHQKTQFRLSGAHAAVICTDCHKPLNVATKSARFHFENRTCSGCHTDPHKGRFEGVAKASCEQCHTTRTWKQIEPFDHARTGFALEGAHRAVECSACHKPVAGRSGETTREIIFRGAPQKCSGCHEDLHESQFEVSQRGASGCDSCHLTLSWKPAKFDHENRARFSLAGAHRAVPCKSCHVHRQVIHAKEVLVYRAAPSECAACHKNGTV